KKYEAEMISVSGIIKNGVLFKSSKLSVFLALLKNVSKPGTHLFILNDKSIKYSLNIFDSNYVLKHIRVEDGQREVIHINW
ncbi:hypothetical protein, partial [Escherichia coli]|uniref:hypothetical protein n=1 Tax=Escherichia coli TaxID=562 RepID=UPI00059EF0F6